MCGRFSLVSDAESLRAYYQLVDLNQYRGSHYNISPGQKIAAVVSVNAERHLEYFRWGLIPSWAKTRSFGYSTINARVETVHSKPAFRRAFRYRRCIIPADGFYEWQGEPGHKQAWRIEPKDKREFLSFAGIWEAWERDGAVIRSCAIIVGDASGVIKPIHDRMPVMLPQTAFSLWLDQRASIESLRAILNTPGSENLVAFRVSAYVNNPHNDGPDCAMPMM